MQNKNTGLAHSYIHSKENWIAHQDAFHDNLFDMPVKCKHDIYGQKGSWCMVQFPR